MTINSQDPALNQGVSRIFDLAAKVAYGRDKNVFFHGVGDLWQIFTQKRGPEIADYLKHQNLIRAYVGYYTPLYAAKIALLLKRLQKEHAFDDEFGKTPLRLLDLGAGGLAGTLGTFLAFGRLGSVLAVDRSNAVMKQGIELCHAAFDAEQCKIRTVSTSLLGPEQKWRPFEPVDFVVMAHVLNEMKDTRHGVNPHLSVVERALRCLRPGGYLLVVEPATQDATRALMQLRDQLFHAPYCEIIAPCTGAERCPLLLDKTSWCRSEYAFTAPKSCAAVDIQLGFDRRMLEASYLLIRKGQRKARFAQKRVVSGVMRHEGIVRRYACTVQGLVTISKSMDRGRESVLETHMRGELIDESNFAKEGLQVERER